VEEVMMKKVTKKLEKKNYHFTTKTKNFSAKERNEINKK